MIQDLRRTAADDIKPWSSEGGRTEGLAWEAT
jgi:hypothetical protein